MKRLRLVNYFVCFFLLHLKLKLQVNNPQLHYFFPFPNFFSFNSILSPFYNLFWILHCFFITRFIMNLLQQILWHLPVSRMYLQHLNWLFLRRIRWVLRDVMHLMMFSFLFLCNILPQECRGVFRIQSNIRGAAFL